MGDTDKTKKQLLDELAELRRRVVELEAVKAKYRRAEEKASRSKAYLESSLNSIHEGVLLLDEQARFTYVNPAFLGWMGRKPEDFIGKGVRDISPPIMTPAATKIIVERSAKRVQTGEPLVGAEIEIIDKNGRPMPVSYSASGIRDDEGKVIGEVIFVMDITERKRAEEELLESEVRFRGVFESGMIGTLFWNADGDITDANDTFLKMVGYTRDEVLSGAVRWRDMTPPEYWEQDDKMLAEITSTGVGTPIEKEYIRKDGSRVPVLLGAASLAGPVINGVAFILDITERMLAEEELRKYREQLEELVRERTRELEEAQEELVRKEKLAVLGQLAGSVSHELRNPLGSIKNAAYLINMVIEQPEPEVKESLEMIDREVTRSDRIITSILSFARPKPLDKQRVNINEVIREALSQTDVPQGVEVVSRLDGKLPTINADLVQLTQCFGNIILNAVQAMPAGGRLTVSSEAVGTDKAAVSVEDSGAGIPRENLEKVFEPLFSTRAKGIGLGLAICKPIVAAHGGTIDVKSEEGKGTTFTVKLPLAEEKG